MADGQEQTLGSQQTPQELPLNIVQQMMAHQLSQQDTTGMTTMQPSPRPTPPAQRPQQPYQQQRRVGPAYPGSGPMIREQRMQNLSSSVSNLANQIGQQVQARKNRQFTQVTDRFTQLVKGINDAKGQVQQGQQLMQQAQQEQDPQRQQQMKQQAQQIIQQAQQSLQQNMANYNDIIADPKQHKIIMKAFGIDDKNAGSPERQAAIQSMQKANQGMSEQGANVMSRLPQTQQLSPEAQQRSQAVQAGVMGRPTSAGQAAAISGATKIATTEMTEAGKNQRAQLRSDLSARLNGQVPDPANPGQYRPMTPEEIANNPILSSKLAVTQATTSLKQAQTQLEQTKNQMAPEQLKLAQARVANLQGNLMMRQKEFQIKVQEEERKKLETATKLGAEGTVTGTGGIKYDVSALSGGRPLQSWAQQTVANSMPVLDQVNGLLKDIEPLKDNNQAGYLALDRIGYAVGIAGENGQLAADISNIELQKVIGGARILKGSSRAVQALQMAMVHMPNAWVDSPKLMYQKLQNLKQNLEGVIRDSVTYGVKNQGSSDVTTKSEKQMDKTPETSPSGSNSNVIVVSPKDMQ